MSAAEPQTREPMPANAADRGLPSVNAVRTVQARLIRVVTFGLFVVISVGLLAWYVRAASSATTRDSQVARAATKAKAEGEVPVPPLGRVLPPAPHVVAVDSAEPIESEEGLADGEEAPPLLGERPPPPHWSDYAPAQEGAGTVRPPVAPLNTTVPATSAAGPIEDRRLLGDVFAVASATATAVTAPANSATVTGEPASLLTGGAIRASRLPTQRWWLPKGTFLDGTLETAIDSTLPGLVTAVLAADTYGTDGSEVLLERGTRLIGEVRGGVSRGQSRLFVEWQEARTPRGVVLELKSPGTDALGRAGLTGEIDRHVGERIGAALLVSIIDGAVQAGVASARGSGSDSVVVSPSGSADIASEVLKDTIGIPTTIRVAPGTRLQVLVARDVDFRGVYAAAERR